MVLESFDGFEPTTMRDEQVSRLLELMMGPDPSPARLTRSVIIMRGILWEWYKIPEPQLQRVSDQLRRQHGWS